MLQSGRKTGPGPRRGAGRARARRGVLLLLALAAFLPAAGCGEGPQGGAKGFRVDPGTLVKDLQVATGRQYVWIPFRKELPVYLDRTYLYGPMPERYEGYPALLTANDDKFTPAERTLVSFTAVRSIRVHVIHSTHRGRLGEEWLNDAAGWLKESWSIGTTLDPQKAVRAVRSRAFAAGERVSLGGTGCSIPECDMYTLLVVPE